ncbi:MAG TPA: FtsX-like permease family protein, partial [Longimicrobiales bacterium]|nr:FtsX-like permease family protein [Longimicrobiales bacterium]
AARPLRWASRVALALCLLTLLLALHGARTTALRLARRRIRELAVRRVLGATDHKVLVHVLAGAARSGAWGAALAVFGGSFLVALLRKAAGGVPAPGPVAYAAVVGLLVGASLVAAVRAGREALAVEPAAVVD